MRVLSILLTWLLAASALAQELPFRVEDDPSAQARAIADLATRTLSIYQDQNRDTYLLNRYRLLLAAERYEDAVAVFDEWQVQHADPPGQRFDPIIMLELYGKAKAAEAGGRCVFAVCYQQAFADRFARFDDRAALDATYYLATPSVVFTSQFTRALEAQKGRDAISVNAGLALTRAHLTNKASIEVSPILNAAVALDDARRYDIDYGAPIKTRHGATLSAIVARRKGSAGPQSTALRFTIYADLAAGIHDVKVAVQHGYVGVVAFARGKHLSPDIVDPWVREAKDTNGAIEWITQQSWSDGQVGMYGPSYDGFAQWAAAKQLHPALKTIVPSVASAPGFGLPMQNNVFQFANYAWPFYVMNGKYLDAATFGDRARWNTLAQRWYESGRPFREIDALDGTPNPLLQTQLKHPSFDRYWQAMQTYRSDYAKVGIPVLTLEGYFDDANAPSVDYLVEHYKYKKDANHYLVIGPYDHQNTSAPRKPANVRGYTIDPVAQIDSVELTYQWFDHVMRGAPRPALIKDKINYQVMGANEWRHAPSIAAMSNETLELFLSATKVRDDYELAAVRPAEPAFLEQTIDFADRKTNDTLYPFRTAFPRGRLSSGYDFVSQPFDAPVTVNGPVEGELHVTINKKDVDVTFALYELTADNRLHFLSYFLGRASYAKNTTRRDLLTPGKREVIPYRRTPLVVRQLSKGSRLLLALTVQKDPYAQINYGTGKDVSNESIADAKEPLRVQWHNDSHVKVPIRR